MTDLKQQVTYIHSLVYDLLRGPGRARSHSSYLSLTPRFEDNLLNEIAALQGVTREERAAKLQDIRSRLAICRSTGWLGEADLEKLNQELDKL